MQEERFEELAGEVTVERSVTLPVDPGSVWEHLADGAMLGDWMGGEVEIDLRPGGRITMTGDDGAPVWGTVEEVVPGRRLQWSWRTDEGMPTQVEIEVESLDDASSRFTVRETLLPWSITGLPPQRAEDGPWPGVFLSAAA